MARRVKSTNAKKKHQILFSRQRIRARVRSLAHCISGDFEGKEINIVGLLKGSFMFLKDLVEAIEVIGKVRSCYVDFLGVSSYGNERKPGDVKIEQDLRRSINGKIVIIVDDVADRMRTLPAVITHIRSKNPSDVRTAVMVRKAGNHERADITLDYVGLDADKDAFLYGYGMDLEGRFRGLPFIAVADPE